MQDACSQGVKAVPRICFQANYKIPTPSLLIRTKSFPSPTMTGKVVGWHGLPFSDTFLRVLSVIIKASEPQSWLCAKVLLCGRCSPGESLTNPYRHFPFSVWSLNPPCSTKPQQKPTDNLQSFCIYTFLVLVLKYRQDMGPFVVSRQMAQKSTFHICPCSAGQQPRQTRAHPPQGHHSHDELSPTTILVLWATGATARISPENDTKKLTTKFIFPFKSSLFNQFCSKTITIKGW